MRARALLLCLSCLVACEPAPRPAPVRPRSMQLGQAPVPTGSVERTTPGECPRGTVRVKGGRWERSEPVTIADFCMDKTEVTAGAYRACVVGEGCTLEKNTINVPSIDAREAAMLSTFCNAQRAEKVNHPMNCVDLAQADAYCRWKKGRLPTEDEWEWAARGGEEARIYPWGDAPPSEKLLNGCGKECSAAFEAENRSHKQMYETDDGWPATAPVGSFPAGASRDGILDLAGNVFEWTSTKDGERLAVDRGGAWSNASQDSPKTSKRHTFDASYRDSSLGFRCVFTP